MKIDARSPRNAILPVAEADQVLDGRAAAAAVVAHDGVAAQELRGAIDEDQRDAGLVIAHEVALVGRAGHDHEPVDAARGERLGELALALLVLVGGADEGEYAVRARDVLDAAVHGGEERVGDVLDDQADARRLPVRPAKRAGGHVAPVAEDLHGVEHALGEVGPRPRPCR